MALVPSVIQRHAADPKSQVTGIGGSVAWERWIGCSQNAGLRHRGGPTLVFPDTRVSLTGPVGFLFRAILTLAEATASMPLIGAPIHHGAPAYAPSRCFRAVCGFR